MDADSNARLMAVLQRARSYLQLPDNEFCWSSWKNREECLNELDKWIACVAAGSPFNTLVLEALFASTGDIQEVSLSSGWASEYLAFAEEFDAAILPFRK